MRFVLVNCHPIAAYPATQYWLRLGMKQWRATFSDGVRHVDMFFWAKTAAEAKGCVRRDFPEATFSDERAHQC